MEKQFDVLVVGELNVDLILNQIDRLPEVGKETLASQMNLTLGSSSAIFACNLSTLGSAVAFAGTVGTDQFGDHVIAGLKSNGVDTQHIVRSTKHATGATVVLNYSEDRAMVTYQGAMKYFSLVDVSDRALHAARHVHVSSMFLQPALLKDIVELLKKAKASGLTTSLDPQWDPDELWNVDWNSLLQYVDIFLPNAKELCALTDRNVIEDALHQIKPFCNIVVIKNGNEGAYLWDRKVLIHQRPFLNRQVVDSIGAGDSFDAGFIHKFLMQSSLSECLEFAAFTGAINTTRPGGTKAFENMALVKTIAQSVFNYSL